MKIAFASPNIEECELFRRNVSSYFESRSVKAEINIFLSPDDMLESIAETVYDIVFFNMNYDKYTGINYVYKMRVFNPCVAIVILQFTPAMRVECIINKPHRIILDSFSPESCAVMLDIVCNYVNTRPEIFVRLRTTKNTDRIVTVPEIIFAESSDHVVYVHISNGEIIEIYGPVRELAGQLKNYPEFLFPHRSFIVNAFYVSCITPDKIYLRNSPTIIPIARGKLKSVKEDADKYFKIYRHNKNLN